MKLNYEKLNDLLHDEHVTNEQMRAVLLEEIHNADDIDVQILLETLTGIRKREERALRRIERENKARARAVGA